MAVSADRFDHVLGRRRGSDRADDGAARSPVDRARRLMSALAAGQGSLLERIVAEQRSAHQLGLELRPGFWSPVDGDERWALYAIYFDDEFVGFSDFTDSGGRLLRFDDLGAGMR